MCEGEQCDSLKGLSSLIRPPLSVWQDYELFLIHCNTISVTPNYRIARSDFVQMQDDTFEN